MNKKTNAKSSLMIISFSYGFNLLMQILKGLILPKLLGATLYGVYTSLTLIFRYGQFSDFGITQLVSKKIPLLYLKKKSKTMSFYEGIAFTWVLITSCLYFVFYFVFREQFYGSEFYWFYRFAIPIAFLIVTFSKLRLLFGSILVAKRNYLVSSKGGIIYQSVSFALFVVLVYFYGIWGTVFSLLIAEIISVVYFYNYLAVPNIIIVTSFSRFKKLSSDSTKLFSVNILEVVISTLDQIFILYFFIKSDLGVYGIGLFLGQFLLIFSGILITYFNPIIQSNASFLKRNAIAILGMNIVFAWVIMFLFSFIVPAIFIILKFYLPDFQEGIKFYYLMVLFGVFRGAFLIYQRLFVALDKELDIIYVYFISILIGIVLNFVSIYLGLGILGIAGSSILVFFISFLRLVFDKHLFKYYPDGLLKMYLLILSSCIFVVLFAQIFVSMKTSIFVVLIFAFFLLVFNLLYLYFVRKSFRKLIYFMKNYK